MDQPTIFRENLYSTAQHSSEFPFFRRMFRATSHPKFMCRQAMGFAMDEILPGAAPVQPFHYRRPRQPGYAGSRTSMVSHCRRACVGECGRHEQSSSVDLILACANTRCHYFSIRQRRNVAGTQPLKTSSIRRLFQATKPLGPSTSQLNRQKAQCLHSANIKCIFL